MWLGWHYEKACGVDGPTVQVVSCGCLQQGKRARSRTIFIQEVNVFKKLDRRHKARCRRDRLIVFEIDQSAVPYLEQEGIISLPAQLLHRNPAMTSNYTLAHIFGDLLDDGLIFLRGQPV